MNNTTIINPPADDATTHEELVDNYIARIKRIQEEMTDDRKEILMLQSETRIILDDVMSTLKAS